MKNRDKLARYFLLIAIFLVLFLSAFFVFRIPSQTLGMAESDITIMFTKTNTPSMTKPPSPLSVGEMGQTSTMKAQVTKAMTTTLTPSICAQVWEITPPAVLPAWLGTPSNSDGLFSEINYFYLAGELITHDFVNADNCPDGGLTADGVSNTCGMEKALNEVVFWQNQFNPEILKAALNNQIPAQIIKRLFAHETQFWPPTEFMPPAYGLGNVTSRGIDPLFKWYADIYQDTCRDLYLQSCSQQYSSLHSEDTAIFRGSFITRNIDAYCPTCQNGIDLEKTKGSIDYFAKLLVANCKDVNETLSLSGFSRKSLTYEDAWRLTLTNYTIGEGCVSKSLESMDNSFDFSWDLFTNQIETNCGAAQIIANINSITR